MNYNFKKNLSKIGLYILQIFLSLVFLFPLIWMVESSFKPENQIFKDMGSLKTFLITTFTLSNYQEMLSRIPFFRYVLNSIAYVFIIAIAGIVVNSLCGYALARLRFPGYKIVLTIIISPYILPFETVLLPLYLISNKFGSA